MNPSRSFRAIWLGRRPYAPVHELQLHLHGLRRSGEVNDTLLLLEHTPVITRGRGAREDHVLVPPTELARAGIDFVDTGRGGDVTLHAPGQLVAYPIFDLSPDWRDVRRYVRALTEVMAQIAATAGVSSGTLDGYVGLWVDAESVERWPGQEAAQRPVKLGAVGVRISRWITMHGFALNLDPDLSLFRFIVPCGIHEHGVTSLERLTGSSPSVTVAAELAREAFARVFRAASGPLEDLSDADPHQLFAAFPEGEDSRARRS